MKWDGEEIHPLIPTKGLIALQERYAQCYGGRSIRHLSMYGRTHVDFQVKPDY